MLKNGQKENQDRIEIEELIGSETMKVVECIKGETPYGTNIRVTLYATDHEITTDELAASYNILYPRYSVICGDRDLSMEVSSPGLQRNFKDYYEFEVFTGKCVRVYSDVYSSWIIGDIVECKDEQVELKNAVVEDTKEKMDTLVLPFASIQKAKLEFRWEEK